MLAEYSIVVTRLILAAGVGGLIGLERSFHGRAAGFRTHALAQQVLRGRIGLAKIAGPVHRANMPATRSPLLDDSKWCSGTPATNRAHWPQR